MKMQTSIMSLTKELASIELIDGMDSAQFNESLAKIQSLIGQSDGMLASLFFDDDTIARWCTATFNQRCETISQYIKLELDICFKE
jgi:hypothetical protein